MDEARDALQLEVAAGTTPGEDQIMMDNGVDWMPKSVVIAGDIKEVRGLWERRVFRPIAERDILADCKFIDMRLLHKVKVHEVQHVWS